MIMAAHTDKIQLTLTTWLGSYRTIDTHLSKQAIPLFSKCAEKY